ncbi:MAG: type II toxin-antitoxin system prevent-host-death family antitoxin [Deltaproteobacteria bacterium]|nr:type II toxin-antitoxin system prevent-host-death family antitoxin [Deltaproteobacteria bacterium]
METYNIHEAKAQFSRLMRQVQQGEEILIARDGRVIARIVPETKPHGIQLGRDKGKGTMSKNFDAPLDDFADYVKR